MNSYGGEGPAGATLALVLDGGDGALLAPVHGGGERHVAVRLHEVRGLEHGAPVHVLAPPPVHDANELVVQLHTKKK